MDYLTVPILPSVSQLEKEEKEHVSSSTLISPGSSLGQVSGYSTPSPDPSTIMAITSMIPPGDTRSKDLRKHSKAPKTRRGSKGTHSSVRAKATGKSFRYQAKRKHRRRRLSIKALLYRSWHRVHPYLITLRRIIHELTQSVFFDIFICTVVAINITMLVAQTFAVVEIRGEWFFSAMDPAFLSVYVVEAILKIIALDLEYFRDPWNDIDFFIMIMTVLDFVLPLFISSRQGNRDNTVALLRVLKICKGIRAIRAIRFLLTLRVMRNLQEITSTFMLSSQAIGAIILLMFSFLFMSSVVLRDMFHDADPKHFGDLFKTIFTLFQMFTLDDWSLIYLTCHEAGSWYIIIFLITYILVEYFLLLK
nr:PREDICTED: cation channel sperm-associated protein 1 [Anolis carolinensis]|eukprot:XP_016853937.1 PREDICTED: cation channel sperm-associated protein 1 [Anolis carolinensis]